MERVRVLSTSYHSEQLKNEGDLRWESLQQMLDKVIKYSYDPYSPKMLETSIAFETLKELNIILEKK